MAKQTRNGEIPARASDSLWRRRCERTRLHVHPTPHTMSSMSDVTRILSQIESGDHAASGQLFPLVYDELRKLAAAKLAHEKPGQTLQATALVHEAYVRLAGGTEAQSWTSRTHFFGAAAEAMRRILVDQARRKSAVKHGGQLVRQDFDEALAATTKLDEEVIAVHEALDQLHAQDRLA